MSRRFLDGRGSFLRSGASSFLEVCGSFSALALDFLARLLGLECVGWASSRLRFVLAKTAFRMLDIWGASAQFAMPLQSILIVLVAIGNHRFLS